MIRKSHSLHSLRVREIRRGVPETAARTNLDKVVPFHGPKSLVSTREKFPHDLLDLGSNVERCGPGGSPLLRLLRLVFVLVLAALQENREFGSESFLGRWLALLDDGRRSFSFGLRFALRFRICQAFLSEICARADSLARLVKGVRP